MKTMAVPVGTTVPMSFLLSALRHLQAPAHEVEALLLRKGIDPGSLKSRTARIPLTRYADLQLAVRRMMDDESLGYVSVPSKVGTWQMACFSAVHPGSIGHSLGRMCRFYRLLERGLSPRLIVEGDDALIEMVGTESDPQPDLYMYEMTFMTMWRFVSWLLKRPVSLCSVTLPHAAPEHVEEYEWMFPGAQAVFGRPRAALRFDRAVLDLPVRRDGRDLQELLQNDVQEITCGAIDDRIWADRLRTLLTKKLPWLPEFEEVAAQFSIHPQTLRRRLACEGFSFSEIRDQVRCEAAKYYLSKQFLPVEEVAQRSGFSEASSLIRAFNRWTGMTPSAYAKQRSHRGSDAQRADGSRKVGSEAQGDSPHRQSLSGG